MNVNIEFEISDIEAAGLIGELQYYVAQSGSGTRDRAILALLYGCGLRRNEAVNMNLSQVDLNKGELVIINTKSRKERLVPLIGRAKDDLEEYILEGRYWFTLNHAQVTYRDKKLNNAVKDALILNQKGGRLTRGFYDRLNILKQRSNIQ